MREKANKNSMLGVSDSPFYRMSRILTSQRNEHEEVFSTGKEQCFKRTQDSVGWRRCWRKASQASERAHCRVTANIQEKASLCLYNRVTFVPSVQQNRCILSHLERWSFHSVKGTLNHILSLLKKNSLSFWRDVSGPAPRLYNHCSYILSPTQKGHELVVPMSYCCSFEIFPNFKQKHQDFHFITDLINYEASPGHIIIFIILSSYL